MNKLVKLLNEFEKVKTWYATYTTRWEKSERELKSDYMYDEDQNIIQIYIISKSFWFIKWLVENDKIDRDNLLKENWQFRLFYYDLERVKNYDRLVMYLSVEDNPIEFLISILN